MGACRIGGGPWARPRSAGHVETPYIIRNICSQVLRIFVVCRAFSLFSRLFVLTRTTRMTRNRKMVFHGEGMEVA